MFPATQPRSSVAGLLVERALERTASRKQAGFHCPDRDVQDVCEFGDGSTLEVMEHEDRPLVDVEPLQSRVEDGNSRFARRGDSRVGWHGHPTRHDLADIAASPSTVRHPRCVHGHALEPGLEAIPITQVADLSPRSDEGFLGGVGRVRLIAEDRVSQSVYIIHPSTHDLLERGEVTVASPFYERSVGRG
jgi:hypothetical protein